MKKLTLTILTCLIFLTPNVVLSDTFYDLVYRYGLWFKKFSQVPFTGNITGKSQGAIKNGKEDGAWVYYHDNGQLRAKVNYKNGKPEGAWVSYHDKGQLKYKGNYKNVGREGAWVYYNKDGTVDNRLTGTYKNGKKVSD